MRVLTILKAILIALVVFLVTIISSEIYSFEIPLIGEYDIMLYSLATTITIALTGWFKRRRLLGFALALTPFMGGLISIVGILIIFFIKPGSALGDRRWVQ